MLQLEIGYSAHLHWHQKTKIFQETWVFLKVVGNVPYTARKTRLEKPIRRVF